MNLKKLSMGLVCGGVIAIGAVACGGETTTGTTGATGATGATGSTGTDANISTCDPSTDTDPAAPINATLTHLGIPNMDGFNLDGINNAAKPGGLGATVAGCNQKDYANGVDNGLGMIATSLGGVIDLNTAIQQTLVHPLPDGGTSGSVTGSVTVTHLNAGVNDPCVGLSATIGLAGSSPITVNGSGSVTNNVLTALFDNELTLSVQLSDQIPPSSCTGGVCSPGTLTLTVRGARARAVLNAAHTQALPGSLIGGYVFFYDAGAAYTAANATGFKASLNSFATMVGLGASFTTQAVTAFQGAQDLHMEPDGTLTAAGCTGTASTSNRNAVSVALSLDSI